MNELLIGLVFRSARFGALVSRAMAGRGAGNASAGRMTSREPVLRRAAAMILTAMTALAAMPSRATDCAFEPQGDGHVSSVIDGRSFRLADGREIKLAGIEPVAADTTKADRTADLSAIIAGKDVGLRGEDDAPDRYGRQSAFVFLAGSDTPVQSLLLKEGAALVSSEITEKACATALPAAEDEARRSRKGAWPGPAS
jgi:endonuclease YncB( thermonuclease family)